jgi:hypothetical protein
MARLDGADAFAGYGTNFFGRAELLRSLRHVPIISDMLISIMRALLILISAVAALAAAPPAGVWQCLLPAFDHSLRPFVFTLKTSDTALTGFIKGEIYDGVASPDIAIFDGKTDGAMATFFARIPVHGGVRLTRYTGTLADDSTMALRIARADGRRPPVTCTAKRVAD